MTDSNPVNELMVENAGLRADVAELRALLHELIDIEGPQPGTSEWANKVRRVLENKPDYREPNYRDDPRPSEVIAKDGWPDEPK